MILGSRRAGTDKPAALILGRWGACTIPEISRSQHPVSEGPLGAGVVGRATPAWLFKIIWTFNNCEGRLFLIVTVRNFTFRRVCVCLRMRVLLSDIFFVCLCVFACAGVRGSAS